MGDVVVTRHNELTLVTGRGRLKNGDDWIVQSIGEDGSTMIQRIGGGAVAQVPSGYVLKHVELGYASTAHRAKAGRSKLSPR